MFKFKITPDRHNAIQKLNYCVLPHPPNFSLLSTFTLLASHITVRYSNSAPFPHFPSATLLCPKCTPLCSWTDILSPLFWQSFISALTLCQTYTNYFCQRNKRPCCLSEKLRYFYEGGGDRKGWDNKRFTALVPAQISLQLLPLQLLEVSGIQRKIIRMILTESKNKNNFPLIWLRLKLSVKIRIRIWPLVSGSRSARNRYGSGTLVLLNISFSLLLR